MIKQTSRLVLLGLWAACDAPSVPEHPTWADVEPILRGHCAHCHGAQATQIRFDFFEMNEDVCGVAAQALDGPEMAHGYAPLIESAITLPTAGARARMPPSPAPALSDWERDTLLRWAKDPQFGAPPRDNRRPQVAVVGELEYGADGLLDFTVYVDDPDGEPVVGVLELGPKTLKLDGPGAFRVTLDLSGWQAGYYPALASLCDGWDLVRYELPDIVVLR